MGNCIATHKVVSENDEIKQQQRQQLQTSVLITKKVSDAKQDEEEGGGGKRRIVRFKLSEDQIKVEKNGQEDSGKGAVRIRVVVTKEELRQILKHRKDFKGNSLEQLVSTLRLRERRINETCSTDHIGGSWKPALESIPEDQ